MVAGVVVRVRGLLTALGFASSTPVILGTAVSPGQVLITNTGHDSADLPSPGHAAVTADCLTGYGYYGLNVGIYSMWFVSGRSGNLAA